MRPHVMLYGLEPAVALPLAAVLEEAGSQVESRPIVEPERFTESIAGRPLPVIFCAAAECARLLRAFAARGLRVPLVVAARQPNTNEWLDALEQGAADYCGLPFDRSQVGWIVKSAIMAAA